MKQAPDSIHIITSDPSQGETLQKVLNLRGFDRIRAMRYEEAKQSLHQDPPVLAVVDLSQNKDVEALESLLKPVTGKIKVLVLADAFQEDLFLRCHDWGVRDYLMKPIPETYLIARVIHLLQEARLEQILQQKDSILIETGVLSERSGCFTTSYLMKQLERQMALHTQSNPLQTMSLVLVALQGGEKAWRSSDWTAIYAEVADELKNSARGLDIIGEYLVDKFAVLLPNTGKPGAMALLDRLRHRLDVLCGRWTQKTQMPLSIQLGLAESTHCRHYEDLLNQARASLGK
jgi:PleD family two-component response regulator